MEQNEIKKLYESILCDAMTTIDLAGYYNCVAPWILAEHEFVCSDGEMVRLYLVQYCSPNKSEDYYLSFKVRKENEYFEYRLTDMNAKHPGTGLNSFRTKEEDDRAITFLSDLWNGGKSYIEHFIKQSGILWCDTLLVTDKRMDSVKKLSSSCTIAIFGEVFHGIEDIESYCHSQTDESSPYILKRTFIKDDSAYDCNIYTECRCVNYLICRDKAEATAFAKTFIGLKRICAFPEYDDYYEVKATDWNTIFLPPREFPPMICTSTGLPYFLFAFIEGYD